MKQIRWWMCWILVAVMTAMLSWRVAAADVESAFSGKWRIQVGLAASADTTLVFSLTPRKQATIAIPVVVKAGRPPDGIARDIRAQFSRKLGRSAYTVTADRNEVIVAAGMGTPRLELKVDAAGANVLGVVLIGASE